MKKKTKNKNTETYDFLVELFDSKIKSYMKSLTTLSRSAINEYIQSDKKNAVALDKSCDEISLLYQKIDDIHTTYSILSNFHTGKVKVSEIPQIVFLILNKTIGSLNDEMNKITEDYAGFNDYYVDLKTRELTTKIKMNEKALKYLLSAQR